MVLNRVLAQEWSQREAAEAVGLSERQIRRLLAEYEREGPKALIHGNRGRQPAHTLPAEVRERVVALARDQYAGFNHQHLTERLVDVEQLVVGRTTVRQMLLEAGLPSPRTRRPPQHRSRRERKPQAGMLLQADGSRHRWLGADGPYLTLIGGIDDATGTVPWALFREQEDAQGYMLWLWQVVEREGIPLALYVDRHGIFKRDPRRPLTLEEELAGGPLPTQFGRVLAELGITPIYALSPEAKGRVERLWGTLQDRLVSELRLAGATTREAANQVLVEFLPRFDARFAVPAAQPGSAYRPRPAGLVPEQVFCFKYTRTVTPDNTVDFAKQTLQLLPDAQRASYVRAQVEVHERLDGSLVVFYQGRCLATRPAPPSAPVLRARTGPRAAPSAHATPAPSAPKAPKAPGRPPRPAPDHPWRRPYRQPNQLAATSDRPTVSPPSSQAPSPSDSNGGVSAPGPQPEDKIT